MCIRDSVAPDGLLFLCGKRRRRRHGLLGGKPVLAEKLQKRKPKQLGDGLEQYNIRIIQSAFPKLKIWIQVNQFCR